MNAPQHAHRHEGEHDCAAATPATLKDPVCGMTVTPRSPHTLEHDGVPY